MKTVYTIGWVFTSVLLSAQGIVNNGNSLVVGSGAFVTVKGTGAHLLNSSGGIDNSGVISLQGNWTNNATNGGFTNASSSGTLLMDGSSSQTLGGSAATNFKNLTLNNSAGAVMSANGTLKGTLLVSSGTFNTNGNSFTLVSDPAGTARIAPIAGNVIGNITMERYLPAGNSGWRFLASPVTGATLNDWSDDFITSGFPGSTYPSFPFVSIYTYDESAAGNYSVGYLPANSGTDPITPGKGYWCYIGSTSLTVKVTGPAVKFNQSFSVVYTNNNSVADDGWNMIGNPYPSSIDWSSASWTKTNINNAVYIWNPQLQQYSSWVAGVGTNGGSNIIPSSQSFWVQANAASPVLQCNENVKSATDQSFIRPASSNNADYMKLMLLGNGFSDEAYLRFDASATDRYDGQLDARKFPSDNPLVPSLSSWDSTNTDMAINSLMPWSSERVIPVKTTVGASGTYTIVGDSMMHMAPGFCIMLEDLVTGVMTDLRTTAQYTFNIEDTTKAPRFLIRLGKPVAMSAVPVSCYGSNNGKAVAKGTGSGPWSYTWYSSHGDLLGARLNSGVADTLRNLSSGTYSVMISDPQSLCGLVTSTVSVSEPPPVLAGFDLMTTTVGTNDSVVVLNTSTGASSFEWDFGDGSQVQTSSVPQKHYYASPGNYTISLRAETMPCYAVYSKTIEVIRTKLVGISEESPQMQPSGWHVYPNPGSGHFYLSGTQSLSGGQLQVFSVSGSLIYDQPLNGTLAEFDLGSPAKGIYIYKVLWPESGKTISGKLVVQ